MLRVKETYKLDSNKFNLNKGDFLEYAILNIERYIHEFAGITKFDSIEFFPKYKKISGYEIDLLVIIHMGDAYSATFIFECKNWEKKIGRPQITEFSEKIKKCNATKGFFVAPSFTQPALDRVEQDERMETIIVKQASNSDLIIPVFSFKDENDNEMLLSQKFNKKRSFLVEEKGETLVIEFYNENSDLVFEIAVIGKDNSEDNVTAYDCKNYTKQNLTVTPMGELPFNEYLATCLDSTQ